MPTRTAASVGPSGRYDGHPTDLEIMSVTDERGEARPYEEDSDDGVVTLTIAGDDTCTGRRPT